MTPKGAGSGPRLVLASASARRRQILESIGIEAAWVDVDLDESPLDGEEPAAMVARLARAKAVAGLATCPAEHDVVVIGADTTVVLGADALGKPVDDREARAMLRRLSGRWHQVTTGVAVATGDRCQVAVDTTGVEFRALDDDDIERYLASGEHRGKAGAYAIQGRAGLFVPRIDGSHHTVIGLPLLVLDRLCHEVAGRGLLSWAEVASEAVGVTGGTGG
jgi:septum formation protein